MSTSWEIKCVEVEGGYNVQIMLNGALLPYDRGVLQLGTSRQTPEQVACDFLAAALEAYEYKQRTGRCSDNIELFPLETLEALWNAGITTDDIWLAQDAMRADVDAEWEEYCNLRNGGGYGPE